MIQIRPISDLVTNFSDIETSLTSGEPIYLTKDGYGSMVVMSIEAFSRLTDPEEYIMDIADSAAEKTDLRLSSEDIFGKIRSKINE